MRTFFISLFICFTTLTQTCIAQTVDFEWAMELTASTEAEIDSLDGLCKKYGTSNLDTAIQLSQKLVELTYESYKKERYANALITLGALYIDRGETEEGQKVLEEAEALAEKLGANDLLAASKNKLGYIEVNRGEYENAQTYFLNAIEIWKNIGDDRSMFQPLLNIAWINFNMMRFNKAQEYVDRAADLAEKMDDDKARMYVAGNQAIIYMQSAENYALKADSTVLDPKPFQDSSNVYVEKTMTSYTKSYDLAQGMDDKGNMLGALNNMVALKINTEAYSEAIELNKQVEQLANEIGALDAVIQSKYNMAGAYRYMKNYAKAIEYGEEGLKLAQENGFVRKEALAHENLYFCHKELGLYDKALLHFEAYTKYVEETTDVERNAAFAEIETKFEVAEKERMLLASENEVFLLEVNAAKAEKQRNYFIGGALILLIGGFFGYKLNQVQKERNDKKAFTEALILAQEEERKRISRDLHDGVGQSLLLIKKQMETNTEATQANRDMISETLEEVRCISRDLHPFQLGQFGLTAALKDVVNRVAYSTDLFVTSEIQNIDGALASKDEIHLFRTIQEALSNVVKHAQATASKVEISIESNNVLVAIMDNGKGFDSDAAAISKSLGMRTMQERISAIGGTISFDKNDPNGTRISIKFPRLNKA
ncbi:MAG: signal transduction histidine kinase [Bacteroidia bacterium]|jgi:signal transduction histidine kinase